MKKRILALVVLFVALFTIVGCKDEDAKTFNVTFDSKGGTTVQYKPVVDGATMKEPAAPTYVENGMIREFLGWYLEDGTKFDFSKPIESDLLLIAKWGEPTLNLAGGKNGALFNYKYATADYRDLLAATLERWLIDKGISIPLYYGQSLVMYSERITPASPVYVANMGYGATYGSFTGEDNYTSTTTAFADSLNHFDYRESSGSDVLGMVEGSIYAFEWNEDFTGFKPVPEFADGYPVPVNKDASGKWVETLSEEKTTYETLSRSWKVTIRDDLKWSNGTAITLTDFVDNIKIMLDPANKWYRANSYYSGSFVVVNAKKYYDGDCAWEKVGIAVLEEENAIVYTITQELAQIDFMYNTASFLFGPVNKAFYDSCVNAEGDCTFGSIPVGSTKVDTLLFSGEFVVDYYEDDKEIRYTRNPYYVANEKRCHGTVFNKFTVKKVGSSEAAWELFLNGEVDVAGVPSKLFAQYKDDPRAKASPGATVYRLSINQASDEEVATVTGGAWKGNMLMQNENFRWALYFGVDRYKLAKEVLVTYDPCQFYVNEAYLTAVQAKVGYRHSAAAAKVAGTELTNTGINLLEATYGYSATDAVHYYQSALDDLVLAGKVDPSKETTLSIELNVWPATSQPHVEASKFIAEGYEKLFNSQTKYPNIKFDCVEYLSDASESYNEKQMLCKYDLAIGGISGGELDVLGLFDVWSSADTNGLKISWGVNTVDVIESNLILWDGMWWTYDALVYSASSPTWVKGGAVSHEFDEAVADCQTKLDALFNYVKAEKALEGEALEAWSASKDTADMNLSEVLTPAEAYAVLNDYISVCEIALNKVLLEAEANVIYANYTKVALEAIIAQYAAEDIYNWLIANDYEDYATDVAKLLAAGDAALKLYEADGFTAESYEALKAAYAGLNGWYQATWA